MIKLDYKNDKPLHEQITQGIKELIICKAMAKDEQLPSVRDLSVSLTVNPNTVQRAYKTLESEGFIYSVRGRGNYVSDIPSADKKTIDTLYDDFQERVKELIFFGEDRDKILLVLNRIFDEMEDAK